MFPISLAVIQISCHFFFHRGCPNLFLEMDLMSMMCRPLFKGSLRNQILKRIKRRIIRRRVVKYLLDQSDGNATHAILIKIVKCRSQLISQLAVNKTFASSPIQKSSLPSARSPRGHLPVRAVEPVVTEGRKERHLRVFLHTRSGGVFLTEW